MTGDQMPHIAAAVPGPRSREWVDRLARHECPAVTARRDRRAAAIGAANYDPIVFAEAVGANVLDTDDNRYVDLTSGFGVAFVGHRHPDVVAAVHSQSSRLLHAMGDAYPDTSRIELLERIAAVCPGDLDISLLGLSGSDAVDGAVKTAVLATGRSGVLSFGGSYHGLALGVLGLQGYKSAFTEPFRALTHPGVQHLPWGCDLDLVREALATQPFGLVIVEPIQGRGGMRTAPEGWHAQLAALTRAHGALLAHDEIQSGLGRTGTWFAGTHEGVVPDLLCLGKALGGGLPLSAVVGSRAVMNAWGASKGEALHTQTFLGHPLGCAAANAVLDLIERDKLVERAAERGTRLRERLHGAGFTTDGRGLMVRVNVGDGLAVCRRLLERGYLTLPAGSTAEALGLTPPVCLTDAQIDGFVHTLAAAT